MLFFFSKSLLFPSFVFRCLHSLLYREHTKLKVRYEELEESFNSTIEDLTTRAKEAEQSRDSLKVHFTRIHDLNKRNEVKLEKKRLRINNLEAELLKYKEADEVRRREKGKGRALDQDDNTFHHHHVGNEGAPRDESFAIPRARARSRQVSNKSVDIDDTSLFLDDDAQHEDFEESLLITQVPESDHEELVDIGNEEDEDAFADLDVILSESKPFNANRSLNKSKQSVLSRDPLKEWTNNEKSGKSTLVQQQHPDRSSSSLTQSNGGKKRSLNLISSSSNASDKWADMAIYGKNRNGKSTTAAAAGEKKKARTIF